MKKEMKSAAKVKKCSLCSKPAWETSSFCQKHYEDNDGPNKVLRLTEMEKWMLRSVIVYKEFSYQNMR
jgi:hypothetical protein